MGGARGGATVTAMGAFAGSVSSYRRVIMPLSVRVCDCCTEVAEVLECGLLAVEGEVGAIPHVLYSSVVRYRARGGGVLPLLSVPAVGIFASG